MVIQDWNDLLSYNQKLASARDEIELIKTALRLISLDANAQASSLLLFDEWGQPGQVYSFGMKNYQNGTSPEDYLNTVSIRNRCHMCSDYHATSADSCPLLSLPEQEYSQVQCFPLITDGQQKAILNLFLAEGPGLSTGQQAKVQLMLREISDAAELMRFRRQKMVTLKEIKSPVEENRSVLLGLVSSLGQGLEFDASVLRIRIPGYSELMELTYGNVGLFEGLPLEDSDKKTVQDNSPEATAGIFERTLLDRYYVSQPVPTTHGQQVGFLHLVGSPRSLLSSGQKKLIESVAQQIGLTLASDQLRTDYGYNVIMQERARLAREIHDSLAQTLAYLKLTAAQMKMLLSRGELERVDKLLSEGNQALAEAYQDTRLMIDNLRQIPREGIATWLNQISEDFQHDTGISVEIHIEAKLPEISAEIQAQLMRVVQESLSNVRKHALASRVKIKLEMQVTKLVLEIQDNGRGFNPEDVPQAARFGLRGMRERAELIGAEIQIVSSPGKGTMVKVIMPVFETKEMR